MTKGQCSKRLTLDYTIRIGSTVTFLYFDLYLYSAYAGHYVYFTFDQNIVVFLLHLFFIFVYRDIFYYFYFSALCHQLKYPTSFVSLAITSFAGKCDNSFSPQIAVCKTGKLRYFQKKDDSNC